ncbi:MAG TPA: lysophospholipid acyltransferase family protein [Terrimicrobiaceae bacterium]|nr:lysophospholipid acyltransferase family protein [Terrimicrobiaceae bacterium]
MRVSGEIPAQGLVVCNHLSYIDILVILSVHPATFVAKSEVRRWPFFGLLTSMAGTIFVERDRRVAISAPLGAMVRTLKAGQPVVLFPEGTSSDGATILPFRTALLEAASLARVAVTPVAIDYNIEEGRVADEICYWRDMVFGSHFWNLLGKQGLSATLRFGAPQFPTARRKELARALRLDIAQLRSSRLGSELSRQILRPLTR